MNSSFNYPLKHGISTSCLLLACLCFREICAGGIINIVSPAAGSTRSVRQTVAGRVEVPAVKSVYVSVEPFMKSGAANEAGQATRINVVNGYFEEKISLFPGLNIIKAATSGGRNESARPVFLIAPRNKEESSGNLDNLGARAQIVFTSPKELKVTVRELAVTGVVTDPGITDVDAIIMNTMYFLTNQAQNEPSKDGNIIDFKTTKVKNLQFGFKVRLTEGLNVILARPSKKPSPVENIQMLSLVYEKVSDVITLEEPGTGKNTVIIRGKVKSPEIRQVRIDITALVESELNPGKIMPKSIINASVPVDSEGGFTFETPLQDKRRIYSIKYSPTITVSAGGASASRTLIKWQ